MSVPGRVAPLPLRRRPARAFYRFLPISRDLLLKRYYDPSPSFNPCLVVPRPFYSAVYLPRAPLHITFCFPRGNISDIADLSSATDSDTSGVSFRPDFDTTDDSDSRDASTLTGLTNPEPSYLPDNYNGPLTYLKRPMRCLADVGVLPDFSDNPNNDIDKDLTDIPLDYRRLDQTKVQGRRIEKRWYK
ncbi:hypothetical protein NUU61_007014 [Penicillium alfredii]|uniref:Uncharacterized protein n=1 Tax=Penicillium alfredii TaxID=1506179 RepID=A0A9W9K3X0_9EURO|nr:uncharacterized protein NUU61_007014 [Penicillium alfredii]KAJ5092144.1 hypothetical protein NUU61_007014 [Penicillium alfredii]